MTKSMAALGKSEGNGKNFLAGKFWEEESMKDVLDEGYGVLYENGDDLFVIPSRQ
jgi:hypothetical protein